MTPVELVVFRLRDRGYKPRKVGDKWESRCPAHDDRKPSLSVGEGRDGRALVKCHAGDGCPIQKICTELGLKQRDLFADKRAKSDGSGKITATYDYVDEASRLLFQVVRFTPKDFRQRQPDGNGGWIWKLDRTRRVLYRLPAVLEAVAKGETIYIVEGEKDADAGARAGVCTTTSPMGAGKWNRKEYSETLAGAARIVIVADDDSEGAKHAEAVARHLRRYGNRGEITITKAKTGKDLSDHLAAHHTIDELEVVARDESPAPEPSDDDLDGESATQPAGIPDNAPPGDLPDLDLDPEQAKDVEDLVEQLKGLDPENQKEAMKSLAQLLGKETQATELVELALKAGIELWRDPDGNGYASIPVDDHVEHWPIKSRSFRLWLRGRYYEDHDGGVVGANPVRDAIDVLDGKALFAGDEHEVHVRVAEDAGAVYVDLCDDGWRCVEITAAGWSVRNGAPVRFKRRAGMHALPVPEAGGDITELRPFVNVTDDEWPLVLGWLIGAFHPRGPYPVLNVTAEHGNAKTTVCRALRRTIDPNKSDVRAAPRETHDLMIAAGNGWVCAFDNLSWLRPGLSDDLARLSTGAGFSVRKLYENDEEQLFDSCRPVIVNGIEDVITRPDLLDRSLILHPPRIKDKARRDEETFWAEYDAALPRVLGAVLDPVACALSRIGNIQLDSKPRMADFAKWATAAEPALGLGEGAFLEAYTANRQQGQSLALESDDVTAAIYAFVEKRGYWSGPAGELAELLKPERPRRAGR